MISTEKDRMNQSQGCVCILTAIPSSHQQMMSLVNFSLYSELWLEHSCSYPLGVLPAYLGVPGLIWEMCSQTKQRCPLTFRMLGILHHPSAFLNWHTGPGASYYSKKDLSFFVQSPGTTNESRLLVLTGSLPSLCFSPVSLSLFNLSSI